MRNKFASRPLWIRRLRLRNFRSHADVTWDLDPGVNWFIGPNGIGKTNVLEAIHLLITGRSFRTARLADLVREGADSFLIEALLERDGMPQQLSILSDGRGKRIQLNATTLASAAQLLGLCPGTLLGPHDQDLVKGSPSGRRRYLDVQLAQVDPVYLEQLMRYQRALKQRNVLLKLRRTESIETWEHQLARAGAQLVWRRRQLVEALQPRVQQLYEALAPRKLLKLGYQTQLASGGELPLLQGDLLEQLQQQRERDLRRGVTSVGPHRDDCTFSLGEQEARYFASEGEQRSCVTALRLAEWWQLCESSGSAALRLIDDVGVSIDMERRQRLAAVLEQPGQRFLTSPEPCWDLSEGKVMSLEAATT